MRIEHRIVLWFFLLAACLSVRADIGLLLDAKPNVGLDLGTAEITGAGHAGVYLSRVCPATPVQLRLCRPGELGSVIQSYQDYKENQPYEWNAVPLSIYLYGVDDPEQRPLFGSPQLRSALQELYRKKYLGSLCDTERCIGNPNANWRDSIAAAFVREIYIFEVTTTQEQDEKFIREFNARANVSHYSGFARNCADFAKLVVNTYFPHSTHRDVLNDFGISGPKGIARSFTHYAERHPEMELRVDRVEQVPGTYKRSSDCHEGTEQTFRSKTWLVPLGMLGYHAIPVLAASYVLTGRFNPDHELRKHPSQEAAALNDQLAEAKDAGDKEQGHQIASRLQAERERQLGTSEDWATLKRRFDEVLQTAVADGIVSDQRELRNMFRDLQARGRVYVDEHQNAWMEVESDGQLRQVGLSTDNILSPESDRRLGFQLLLARTENLLSAQPKHRELYQEFQTDWELLQRAETAMRAPGTQKVIATRR